MANVAKPRSAKKEALVTYNGEKMTRVEREAKIREQTQANSAAKAPVSAVRKGTKVAEAAPVRITTQTPKQEKPVEKKESTGEKLLKSLCDACAFTFAQIDKNGAEEDEMYRWDLVTFILSKICKK